MSIPESSLSWDTNEEIEHFIYTRNHFIDYLFITTTHQTKNGPLTRGAGCLWDNPKSA